MQLILNLQWMDSQTLATKDILKQVDLKERTDLVEKLARLIAKAILEKLDCNQEDHDA